MRLCGRHSWPWYCGEHELLNDGTSSGRRWAVVADARWLAAIFGRR